MTSLDKQRRTKSILRYKERAKWFWVGFAVCAVLASLFIFQMDGFLTISNAQSLEFPQQEAYETTVEVDALMSFCGAKVRATYSGAKVTKEHEALGKVYRTDTADIKSGVTNVAVCVDVNGYTAEVSNDRVSVTVQPTSMQLLIPAVDTWGTQIVYNDGADLLNSLNPLVAENNDLIDVTYMWLQLQATEGVCVDAAWEKVIEQLKSSIVDFEMKRAEDENRSLSPHLIDVDINAPVSLENARSKVLAEINLSGVRQREALSLLMEGKSIKVDKEELDESCTVLTEA